MTFLSVLIALLLERMTPQLIELRRFDWLRDYSRWLTDVLHIERFGSWMGLSVLLLPLLVAAWILQSVFNNALFGLFELAFNILVIFFCLGPRELDHQVDQYLDAIDIGDSQQRFNAAAGLTRETPAMDLPSQVPQVCRSIFSEANSRVYAVLFWFAVFGPLAALLYRLLEQWLTQNFLDQAIASIRQPVRHVLGWMDWLPAHITLFAFMVSGSFEDGLQAFRRGNITAIDNYEQNNELLQNVGFQSILSHDVVNDAQAVDLVRKSRGLVLRGLIVWLIIVLLLGWVV